MKLLTRISRLIQKLNKSQIRYLYKTLENDKTQKAQLYLYCIKIIHKNPKISEEKLKNILYSKFPTRIKFSKLKYELYEELLSILSKQILHSYEMEIRKIHLLISFNLSEEANNRTQKLINKLKKTENFEYLPILLNILHKIYESDLFFKIKDKYKILWSEYNHAIKYISLKKELNSAMFKAYSCEDNAALNEHISHFAQQFPEPPAFPSLQIHYYEILSYYFWRNQQYEQCSQLQQTILNIFIENKYLIDNAPNRFATFISNYVFNLSFLQNWEKAFTVTEELLPLIKNKENHLFIEKYLMLKSFLLYKHGDIEKIYKEFPHLEKMYKTYETILLPDQIIRTTLNFAILYFNLKKFNNSLQLINKILNFSYKEIGRENYAKVLILNLIVNMELEHFDLLPYLIRNTYRYLYQLKDKQKLYKHELSILNFIRKYAKQPTNKTQQKQLIISFLNLLKKQPVIQQYLSTFINIQKWLEEKIKTMS